LIETYSKLRQIEEFLAAMYLPISQISSGGGSKAQEFLLDPSFVKPWTATIQQIPLMQIPFIWESLLNELKGRFQTLFGAKNGKGTTTLYENLEPLHCLLTLFGKFLDNILVNTGNKQIVKKLLESTLLNVVKPLLQPLLSSSSQKGEFTTKKKDLLRSGLLFYHSLVDLWMFVLAMPNTKGDENTKEREEALAGIESYFQLVDTTSESICSLLAWSRINKIDDPPLLLVLGLVSLQRMHQLQALVSVGRASFSSSASLARYTAEMSQITTLLFDDLATHFSRIRGGKAASISWNNSLLSLSAETLPVAFWQAIANNIQVLCSLASESHRKLFLEILLAKNANDLLSSSSLSDSVTLASVNLSLVKNSNFYELHPLRGRLLFVFLFLCVFVFVLTS
jgi:hypothetical protein